MVYLNKDGSVSSSRPMGFWVVTEFCNNIISLVSLFFNSIFLNPSQLETRSRDDRSTYAMRQTYRSGGTSGTGSGGGGGNQLRGRGANIRGVKDIGAADCGMAGG